jgi:hypothetical protein
LFAGGLRAERDVYRAARGIGEIEIDGRMRGCKINRPATLSKTRTLIFIFLPVYAVSQ